MSDDTIPKTPIANMVAMSLAVAMSGAATGANVAAAVFHGQPLFLVAAALFTMSAAVTVRSIIFESRLLASRARLEEIDRSIAVLDEIKNALRPR